MKTDISKMLETRMMERLKTLRPNSPELATALTRIGIMLQADAKMNIRRQHIIDSGTLFNSILFKVTQQGAVADVEVGSYGVPYAGVQEYGVKGADKLDRMRKAFFAKQKGRPHRASKGIMTRDEYKARPFLGPAIKNNRNRIIEIIRGLFK